MMSNQNLLKIMQCLADDPTLEMKNDELEKLLEEELAKPSDEIDTDLVNEILDAMKAPEPDPVRMQQDWKTVKANLPRRAKAHTPKTLMRFGAVAAAVIMIMFIPLRDAEAFRWTLIEKLLKPVAETFGIVINDQPSIPPVEDESTLYTLEDAPSETIEYASLEEIPETSHGYPIRPKWIPAGFTLSLASRYTGPDSEIYSLDFTSDEKWFNYRVHIITLDTSVYYFEFERSLDIPIEQNIDNHVVTLYTNVDDMSQYASWIHENANYCIIGNLTYEEVYQFIDSME